MSYQILGWQTSPITGDKVYQILCDTVSDLPVGTISGDYGGAITQGTSAQIIEDSSVYIANSAGTWKKQKSQNEFENVYTKTEIDTLLSAIGTTDTKQENALVDLINSGPKNQLPITKRIGPSNATAATTYTQAGVQFTCNLDGTITIERISANSNQAVLWLYDDSSALLVDDYTDGNYVWSNGIAGSSTTARMRLAKLNAGDYLVIDSYATIPESTETGCNVSLIVYPSFTGTMTFKPMICFKSYYEISDVWKAHV